MKTDVTFPLRLVLTHPIYVNNAVMNSIILQCIIRQCTITF